MDSITASLLQSLADSAQAAVQEEARRGDGTVSGSIDFSKLKPRIQEVWSKKLAAEQSSKDVLADGHGAQSHHGELKEACKAQ